MFWHRPETPTCVFPRSDTPKFPGQSRRRALFPADVREPPESSARQMNVRSV